jgi:hypothetical protein
MWRWEGQEKAEGEKGTEWAVGAVTASGRPEAEAVEASINGA